MGTSSNNNYRLNFPPNTEWTWGFGLENSDLDTVYHYTDFSQTVEIQQSFGALGFEIWSSVTSRVFVSSFTLSYNTTTYRSWTSSQVIWVTGNTTTGTAKLTFGGQHQGVFQRNQWFVRNDEFAFNRNHSSADPIDDYRGNYEVASEHTTMRKSRDEIRQALPNGYYMAYRFNPDQTRLTSITFTVKLSLDGVTSLTLTATQTVRNSWDKFLKEVRDFIYEGKGENFVTRYNQGGTLADVSISSLAVTNTTSVGSGATITVYTNTDHDLHPGTYLYVNVTSFGTGHNKAQGQFNVLTVPTTTSFTYTVTSTGNIVVTTSTPLTATMQYLKLETNTLVIPKF